MWDPEWAGMLEGGGLQVLGGAREPESAGKLGTRRSGQAGNHGDEPSELLPAQEERMRSPERAEMLEGVGVQESGGGPELESVGKPEAAHRRALSDLQQRRLHQALPTFLVSRLQRTGQYELGGACPSQRQWLPRSA